MKNEQSNLSSSGFVNQDIANDLIFMRQVVEKMSQQVKPDVHIMVATGLVSMVANIAAFFLKTHQLDKWIWPMTISMLSVIFIYAVVSLVRIAKHEKKAGFISHLKKQVSGIWIFIVLNGLAWTLLAMLFNDYSGGDPPFVWAMLFSIGLCVLGVFHSKEWLFGSILIFVGMTLTYFVEESAYLILGFAMGGGFIIPALFVQKNYQKQEKNHE